MFIDVDIYGELIVREFVWYKDWIFFVIVYWVYGWRELIYVLGGGLSVDYVKFF